ncbi:RNHCP domain-containing protein [Candidatus Dojkabacteria bacterium]|nr:RNHCP domain-containing protein [Candidatus Dojkabacteria bacterium]
MSQNFVVRNEEFICTNCGKTVYKHPHSCRDHCNYCLHSLHVDINPGDRLNPCKGTLIPIGFRIKNQKDQIVYKCQKCKQLVFNIIAPDDNKSLLIKISSIPWSV